MNAHALARYAALCQEAGIVPIVEPEVLMDGEHTIERCFDVTADVLHAVFDELFRQRVPARGHCCSSPTWCCPGTPCAQQASVAEVADGDACACFRATVPAAVPGIVFLSGGQSDEVADRATSTR